MTLPIKKYAENIEICLVGMQVAEGISMAVKKSEHWKNILNIRMRLGRFA